MKSTCLSHSGPVGPGRSARLLLRLALLAAGLAALPARAEVKISEGIYEGRPHFVVHTGSATWFFDVAGGGFSRLIDREGRDWIAFRMLPDKGPAGAGGKYRGLPNMVYGPDYPESGAGHPGFDHCETVQAARDLLRTTSKSGKWAWTWQFSEAGAVFTLEKADPAQPWWFIYEGPIGGRFAPHRTYWGTDTGGPRREARNYKLVQEVAEPWRWAYFGTDEVARVLAIASLGDEPLPGVLGYLGATEAGLEAPDGMVVFGLGRDRSRPFQPLLRGAGRRFLVAFIEQAPRSQSGHDAVAKHVQVLADEFR